MIGSRKGSVARVCDECWSEWRSAFGASAHARSSLVSAAGPRLRRRALWLLLIALCAAAAGSCIDSGFPPLEEQLDRLKVPREQVLTVNDETRATVHLKDGQPELVIFTPYAFGGWEPHPFDADKATVGGGRIGSGSSVGPRTGSGIGPGFRYIFGASQGPLSEVRVSTEGARSQIVNPDIGGWVIVFPDRYKLADIDWDLIGPDGGVLYSGRGLDPR